jgi:hypothetical protein
MTDQDLAMTQDMQKPHTRRPFLLRLVSLSLFAVAIFGWLRFIAALQNKAFLGEIGFPPILQWYLILSGLLAGLVCLPALWALRRKYSWAPTASWLGVCTVLALHWIERLTLWETGQSARNWAFMLILTVLWLGLLFLSFSLAASRQYLNNTYKTKLKHDDP